MNGTLGPCMHVPRDVGAATSAEEGPSLQIASSEFGAV